MATVLFWEKPGCGGNARQKAALVAAGHEVVAKDLLTDRWTAEGLRTFFGDLPPAEWFNRASPRIKAGEIVPEAMDGPAALAAMLIDPLLIRRPLMEVDGRRSAGFDAAAVDAWIGLDPSRGPVGEGCPKGEAPHPPCPAPTEA